MRIKSETGRERKLTIADVQLWLKHQPRQADGTIRVLASRWVPGKVVGSFRFTGTRPDDPNDIYPHERRRELRGLRVFAAWLNHDDARSLNSIDTYVEEDGRRYIRHYLQDFGSTLGSGSTSAQQPRGGYEYLIEKRQDRQGPGDVRPLAARLDEGEVFGPAVARQHREPTSSSRRAGRPSIRTRHSMPMDAEDAFWAARIAARFSDEMIRAIVAAAKLSDAEAAEQLTA